MRCVFVLLFVSACADRALYAHVDYPAHSEMPLYVRIDKAVAYKFNQPPVRNPDGSTTYFYDVDSWEPLMHSGLRDTAYAEAQGQDEHAWRVLAWLGKSLDEPCNQSGGFLESNSSCEEPPPGAPSGQLVFTFKGEGATTVAVPLVFPTGP
jgi:hypothetical protein